jgi:hypothetical protein
MVEINNEIELQQLKADEQDILFSLYYMQETDANALLSSDIASDLLIRLIEKHLIVSRFESGKNLISLTTDGLDVCGSLMTQRIDAHTLSFKERMQAMPSHGLSCLIHRIIWHDTSNCDTGLWYEQVLLKDTRMTNLIEQFYNVLESEGFIKTYSGQRWCPPEVETFLKHEFKDISGLSWTDEDALKYYFFLYAFAQDQKNLIDFSGDDKVRSLFYEEQPLVPELWFTTTDYNHQTIFATLGISEQRILTFFTEMEQHGIITARYYPMPSPSFFSDPDKLYLIKDIKQYLQFITDRFLTPVVDRLLATH